MRMMSVAALAALAVLHAGTALAADCQLHLFDAAQMKRLPDGRDTIPVMVNGNHENFLFDTGGSRTQISRPLAEQLKLNIRQGNGQLFDMSGNVSRDIVTAKDLVIAHMRGADQDLPVSTFKTPDGIVGLDRFTNLDLDMDFGNDQVKFFSPDHCDGQVVYWTDPNSVGIIPMDRVSGFHIRLTVTLDGHEESAILDTGASYSTLGMTEAKRVFDITPGDAQTPEHGTLNGDATLKVYTHRFTNLSFGDLTVKNPLIVIIPEVVGRNGDHDQLVGDRTKSEKDRLEKQDMIIGMDVLRKLHVYVAFKEHRIYVSPASAPPVAATGAQNTPTASTAAR
jgi:predicted aspartyl protease